jgi:hypothetical protein
MSVFHENMLIGASGQVAAGGISRSIRLNAPDSAYLSRTPASAGNRKTWTWAGWVKRAKLGTNQVLFSGSQDGSNTTRFQFTTSDTLQLVSGTGPSIIIDLRTTQVFRDCSAWGHIVVSVDTTQVSGSGQIKIYYNGVQITAFGTATYPTQNYDTWINSANTQQIGSELNSFGWLDAYLADVYLIDGQALTPSSFTETDATTAQLIPKAYTGSYGTNGFHLEFADNSAATAAALGKDTSGNGNNWTPNNLSVTAGAGNDSLVDVPTNGSQTDTGVGGEVRGNYCTWNPLNIAGGALSNGNLDLTNTAGGRKVGTIGVSSGKWYWEVTVTSAGDAMIGIMPPSNPASTGSNNYLGGVATEYGYYAPSGQKYTNATGTSYGATFTNGDVIGVALDLDAGTLVFYKNGVSQGTAFSSLTGTFAPGVSAGGSSGASMTLNAGARPFAYTAPSGFKALCTANLPAPVVTKPNTVMDVALWTGTGSSQSISGLGFSPDLVWAKQRSSARHNWLTDTVRGVGKGLKSDTTNSEYTNDVDGYLSAFNADGFTYVAGSSSILNFGQSAGTYVAWTWDAGSSTVTNTAGSITSSVRANATAGFSVVTWSTNSSSGNATIGHGLNVAPKLIIMKSRNATYNWDIYHGGISNAKDGRLIFTTAAFSTAVTPFGGVDPTSTVFTMSQSFYGTGIDCVAYCFAPVVGYSSFGSYVGNGSADGVFVFTSFRPKYFLVKNTNSGTANWLVWDSARGTYNANAPLLYPNLSNAEDSAGIVDFLSNGFKMRSSDPGINASGSTYVYAAFAESPFNYSRAR